MKRALLFLAALLLFAPVAEAHVLERDGTIGAVLHIDPDDDPVSGQETSFYFEMKDTTGRFSAAACTCAFTVRRAGTQVGTATPMAAGAVTEKVITTLPEKGVYTLTLSGVPTVPGAFDAFTLNYDIRVAREVGTVSDRSKRLENYIAALVAVAVSAILVLTVFFIRKNRTDA